MVRNQRKKCMILLLIILILAITIGYAALTTSLTISGTSGIHNATWDIHFDHIQETTGSVIPNSTTSINATGDTVTYNITLTTPGDFYEFTVDAVNAGSIDGMIESVTSKLNGSVITTLPAYLDYSVTYSDGVEIASNHLLSANSTKTYKVRVEYKREVNPSDLPTSNQTLNFTFSVNYIQANSNAIEKPYLGMAYWHYTPSVCNTPVVGGSVSGMSNCYTTDSYGDTGLYVKYNVLNDQVTEAYVCYSGDGILGDFCLSGGIPKTNPNFYTILFNNMDIVMSFDLGWIDTYESDAETGATSIILIDSSNYYLVILRDSGEIDLLFGANRKGIKLLPEGNAVYVE